MRLKVLIAILAGFVFVDADAQIQNIQKNKVNYVIEKNKAYIVGFDAKATKVTIESEITYKKLTYMVVGVKSDDYYELQARQNSSVREMVFSEGITEVFGGMAKKMETLEKVVLPSTVTSIGREAFWGCKKLTEINIPSKVKNIGTSAFAGCTALQSIDLPDGLQELGGSAFASCTALKKVSLPKSLMSIGMEAFYNCSSLQEIVIPYNVSKIGDEAFSGCSSLKTAIIQCNVKEIPASLFRGCKSLESVIVPNSVTLVGVQAFRGCSSLKEIILPDNAHYRTDEDAAKIKKNTIYKGSFFGCESLTNIKCHNGSVPENIMAYVPASCPFAKNGGKSEDSDFDTRLRASVENYLAGETKVARRQDEEQHIVKSDVDISIPKARNSNDNTFAVIIGNEDYKLVPPVIYAQHDADVFAEYCITTLGLPRKNVNVIHNATFAEMIGAIKLLKDLSNHYKDGMNIIFYYSGHGIPNEKSHDAFLLPVDVDGSITEVCYSVSKLYKDLDEVKANRTLVFLDACFSGARRDGGVLKPLARGVAISPKAEKPLGNMVVYSAASGDEAAYPYEGKSHGLFTYYLLKSIKETKGNVTLGELADYISTNVSNATIAENKKGQHPTVSPASSMDSSWKNMKLNK